MDSILNATNEYLTAQVTALTEQNAKLESQYTHASEAASKARLELNTMRDGIQHWTLAELERDNITEDIANEIAEICGFELTKEVEVTVNVEYTFTVTVAPNENVEDIIDEINFDSIDYNTDKINWMNCEVNSTDF